MKKSGHTSEHSTKRPCPESTIISTATSPGTSLQSLDDQLLVSRTLAGETHCFEELFRRYSNRV